MGAPGSRRVFCDDNLGDRALPPTPPLLLALPFQIHHPHNSTRVFHTSPQPFRLTNSIPTALPPISHPPGPCLLHSFNNATVCMTLRGASRLRKRRKGRTELGGQVLFGVCGNADFATGHGASNRSRRGRGIPGQPFSALPLGNRVAASETEGEPGASLRSRTKVRGVQLAKRFTVQRLCRLTVKRRSGSQVSAKAAGASHPRSKTHR